MPRNDITYEQVAAVAENLTAKGMNPTLRRLGEHLGAGSPNTLQRHLAAWQAKQPSVARSAPELPQTLLAAMVAEIKRHADAAREEAERTLEEARSDASTLAELGEALEERIAQLVARLEAAERTLGEITPSRNALQAERDALLDELRKTQQTQQESREEAIRVRQRVEMLTSQLEEEQKARQLAERATRLVQVATTKAERNQAVAEAQRDAALEQAREKAEQIEQQRRALQAERAQQRQEISDMRAGHKARLDSAERARQEAVKQAQEAAQRAGKAEIRAEALEATQEALKSRLDALQVQQRQRGLGARKASATPAAEDD